MLKEQKILFLKYFLDLKFILNLQSKKWKKSKE